MLKPSGRTAGEILEQLQYDTLMADNTEPAMTTVLTVLNECQRQLFNAMMEIVGKNDEHDATHNPSYPKEKGYGSCSCDLQPTNQLRAELRQRLAIFFNQPEANGNDGDE